MEKEKELTRSNILPKVVKFWVPVFVWAIIIFSFSSKPTNPVSQIYWKDFVIKKISHIIEYAIFTTLLFRALKESGIERKEAAVYSIILAVLYGLSDEFHQSFTPGREPKVRDVIFDTIGAGSATYTIWSILPKAPERLRSWAKKFHLL